MTSLIRACSVARYSSALVYFFCWFGSALFGLHGAVVICVCGNDKCELIVNVRIVAVLGMVVTYNLFEVQTGTIWPIDPSIITRMVDGLIHPCL